MAKPPDISRRDALKLSGAAIGASGVPNLGGLTETNIIMTIQESEALNAFLAALVKSDNAWFSFVYTFTPILGVPFESFDERKVSSDQITVTGERMGIYDPPLRTIDDVVRVFSYRMETVLPPLLAPLANVYEQKRHLLKGADAGRADIALKKITALKKSFYAGELRRGTSLYSADDPRIQNEPQKEGETEREFNSRCQMRNELAREKELSTNFSRNDSVDVLKHALDTWLRAARALHIVDSEFEADHLANARRLNRDIEQIAQEAHIPPYAIEGLTGSNSNWEPRLEGEASLQLNLCDLFGEGSFQLHAGRIAKQMCHRADEVFRRADFIKTEQDLTETVDRMNGVLRAKYPAMFHSAFPDVPWQDRYCPQLNADFFVYTKRKITPESPVATDTATKVAGNLLRGASLSQTGNTAGVPPVPEVTPAEKLPETPAEKQALSAPGNIVPQPSFTEREEEREKVLRSGRETP